MDDPLAPSNRRQYPDVDSAVPTVIEATTTACLAAEDIEFLRQSLAKFRTEDGLDLPLTVDLNGSVVVCDDERRPSPRAKEKSQRATRGPPATSRGLLDPALNETWLPARVERPCSICDSMRVTSDTGTSPRMRWTRWTRSHGYATPLKGECRASRAILDDKGGVPEMVSFPKTARQTDTEAPSSGFRVLNRHLVIQNAIKSSARKVLRTGHLIRKSLRRTGPE